MRDEVDWIKGRPYTAYNAELPNGYAIDINVAQHQSGKVTIRQSASKTVGYMNPATFQFKFGSLNTTFMDKLNKVLKFEKKVK